MIFFATKNFKLATCSESMDPEVLFATRTVQVRQLYTKLFKFSSTLFTFFQSVPSLYGIFQSTSKCSKFNSETRFPPHQTTSRTLVQKKKKMHFSQKKKSQRNHLFNPVHPHLVSEQKRCFLKILSVHGGWC